MIRLVATDVDGTLFNSRREVSEGNRLALKRAQEMGLMICLASGRYLNTLRPVALEAQVKGPLITCNGAYILNQHGQPVLDECLTSSGRGRVLDYAVENEVQVNIYQPDRVVASRRGAMYALYCSRTRIECEILAIEKMALLRPTKMVMVDTPERIIQHTLFFQPIVKALAIELTTSEPEYLEFLPLGVNKGIGLQRLCDHLGFAREEVAALGDFYNDLEMVQWAGLGGAVGNGAPELKAAADVVVETNDEDGLAQFLALVEQYNVQRI